VVSESTRWDAFIYPHQHGRHVYTPTKAVAEHDVVRYPCEGGAGSPQGHHRVLGRVRL